MKNWCVRSVNIMYNILTQPSYKQSLLSRTRKNEVGLHDDDDENTTATVTDGGDDDDDFIIDTNYNIYSLPM